MQQRPPYANHRDSFHKGRNSTPLHLAAGYNNLDVAEYLLQKGANVNAQDKGGLIPLHNASSYGHMDLASLLIRYETNVNATDRWGYTPLHEAAQKGRTHLSALLLAHGADPFMRNQEGQTPLDLATADDVRSLLQDAMMSPPAAAPGGGADALSLASGSGADALSLAASGGGGLSVVPSMSSSASPAVSSSGSVSPPLSGTVCGPLVAPSSPARGLLSPAPSLLSLLPSSQPQEVETIVMPSGASLTFCPMESSEAAAAVVAVDMPATVHQLLRSLGLEQLCGLFEREDISLDVLCEMSHDDLRTVGVAAYGHRHKLMKSAQRIRQHHNAVSGINSGCTVLVELSADDREFVAVEEEMQNTIREHRDNGHAGGIFSKYN
ncbi:Sterile alpha motif domain, partial [Trinorchestia longiramus]